MKLFCGLIIIITLFGCQQKRVQPMVSNNLQVNRIPSQESWNSKVVFTDSGKTKAILHAGHIQVFSESMETLLDSNIKVDFYDLNQVHSSTLTSKKGRVDDATENLWAMDSVVVVSDSGVTIHTEELMWRNKDRKIVSDKFVTIISPKEKIQGYGFESDQSLRNYIIYNITYITKRDTL
jgi:LPS export ABC transporter protein LptC